KGSNPQILGATKDYLFFEANYPGGDDTPALFRTDGTQQGTILLSKKMSETVFLGQEYHGEMYFIYYTPLALCKSNGTPEGTTIVKTMSDIYGPLLVANDLIFFQGNDGKHGFEPWKSDGTYQGTQQIKDVTLGFFGTLDGSDNAWFTFQDRLFFGSFN